LWAAARGVWLRAVGGGPYRPWYVFETQTATTSTEADSSQLCTSRSCFGSAAGPVLISYEFAELWRLFIDADVHREKNLMRRMSISQGPSAGWSQWQPASARFCSGIICLEKKIRHHSMGWNPLGPLLMCRDIWGCDVISGLRLQRVAGVGNWGNWGLFRQSENIILGAVCELLGPLRQSENIVGPRDFVISSGAGPCDKVAAAGGPANNGSRLLLKVSVTSRAAATQ
jgi:hypothetical protein